MAFARRCNFLQHRRFRPWRVVLHSPAPAILRPVESTIRCNGSVEVGERGGILISLFRRAECGVVGGGEIEIEKAQKRREEAFGLSER